MHGLGHMLGIDVHDVGRYYFGRNHARSSRVS
jgi:Xaa-Pro aminopeptidase